MREWSGTRMGSPGRWCSHCCWRCSRNIYTLHWGIWFSGKYGWYVDDWTGWSCRSPSTIGDSVITSLGSILLLLLFFFYMLLKSSISWIRFFSETAYSQHYFIVAMSCFILLHTWGIMAGKLHGGKGSGVVSWQSADNEPTVFIGGQEGQWHPGLYQK